MSSSNSGLIDDDFPNQLSSVDRVAQQELRHRNNLWRSNYHEASIYIEEGLNNDKFENHPRKRATLAAGRVSQVAGLQESAQHNHQQQPPATPLVTTEHGQPKLEQQQQQHKRINGYILGGQYTTIETYILVHNRYFYQLDLAASVVLLLLALVEPPAVEGYELNPSIHAAIEMFALGIIAIELLLKFRWMGPKRFFRHGRTVTKLVVLLTMNVEAITIFLRHTTHARYSRALRPIFLYDNHYCHGIRRAIRQIFQSLPPILDMFTLALFFMFVFSIFGFYLFASNNIYFSDMPATVGNLLILATTANLPDVMMPSYAVSRWSTVFFVLFIITHLFLLTNLTMAAVYESFTRKEKEKFHKLLLHRRKACQEAFKLLVSRRQPTRIQYRQFMGLMRYLNRKCSMFDAYLIFKAIDTDKSGSISLEEFYQVYDFINLEWKMIYPDLKWYDGRECMPRSLKSTLAMIQRVVGHKFFEWTIDFLISMAAFLQFIEANAFEFKSPFSADANQLSTTVQHQHQPPLLTLALQQADQSGSSSSIRPDSISTSIFIFLFSAEIALRMLACGFKEYFSDGWNRFDVLVLSISFSGFIAGYLGSTPFGWVIVLRVLRIMRLFEFKRRYRDIWQTLTYILLKRFVSMTCVVMILYYFFAIVGMELLGNYDLRNCCKNTSLESQYKFDNSSESAKYYLNDFGDLVASYLTLFSMSSNTYWLATMSAYAIVSETQWIRLFFGIYYLCSIIVMNIVIAFILESFLFRISYRSKMGNNCDDTNLFTVRVTLSSSEVEFLRKSLGSYRNFDDKIDKMIKRIQSCNEHASCHLSSGTGDCEIDADTDERTSLIKNQKHKNKINKSELPPDLLNAETTTTTTKNDMDQAETKRNKKDSKNQKKTSTTTTTTTTSDETDKRRRRKVSSSCCHEERAWYLTFQAEQIRNKFSFTMKMYADEVEGWLAKAERDDQDELSLMISRNQIRAEHVAMARLARRSIVAAQQQQLQNAGPDSHLFGGLRGRSWSSSGGCLASIRVDDGEDDNNNGASRRQKQGGKKSKDSKTDTGSGS